MTTNIMDMITITMIMVNDNLLRIEDIFDQFKAASNGTA